MARKPLWSGPHDEPMRSAVSPLRERGPGRAPDGAGDRPSNPRVAGPILSTVGIVRSPAEVTQIGVTPMGLGRLSLGALLVTSSLAIAGCSGTSSQPSAATSDTSPRPTTQTTASPPTSMTVPPATAPSSQASNAPISDAIRSQLVAAGAALNNIPVSEYSGLAAGLTYYAIDRTTNTYWAAARLVPVPSSDPATPTRAQVASQDDGSYYVFSQHRGGSWTAYAVGASGPASPCPVTLPPQVLEAWGWPMGSCRPENSS